MNINKTTLAGRLTRDPDVSYTPQGVCVTEISIAVNHFWKDAQGENKESVDFFEITAFGKTGEAIGKHLKKGREIYVEGRLKLDQWDDRETGKKRSKIKILADSMQFVGPKPADSGESPAPRSKPAPDFRRSQQQDPDLDPSGEPDNIPF